MEKQDQMMEKLGQLVENQTESFGIIILNMQEQQTARPPLLQRFEMEELEHQTARPLLTHGFVRQEREYIITISIILLLQHDLRSGVCISFYNTLNKRRVSSRDLWVTARYKDCFG